jgi:peptidoglycan hydrolase-like protein with peptidoglycan-binding domain
MIKKKVLGGVLALSIFAAGGVPAMSAAQQSNDTDLVAQLQAQIQILLAQVQQLQEQVAALQGSQTALREEVESLRLEAKQLQIGVRGDDVSLLQETLATDPEIYPEGLVTGYFGPLTKRAVEKFQKKFGISQVGEVGPITRLRLNQLLADGAGKSGKVPPGLLIAPGIAKKLGESPKVPEGQKLPRGIAKKLGLPTDDGDDDGDNGTSTDTAAPTISAFSPADDATEVAADTNLKITFSEVVLAQSGNIVVKKTDDDSVVEEIVAASTTGTGTNVITAAPGSNLATSTAYYVLVDATAFEDGSGNQFAGISASSTWNFTTGE